MYEIINVKENNKFLLDDFLKNKIPATFRYFTKRDSTIIKNHILTLVLMSENKPIGYAHIDYENFKHWLGICIIDEYQNKGYGKILISYILNDENMKNKDIFLTVDKVNTKAFELYSKYNFNVIEDHETYYLMKRCVK